MLLIVMIVAACIMAIGLYGLLVPTGLVKFGRWFLNGPGIWGGAAARAILAVVLWLAADSSLTPLAFKMIAVASAMGAVALPLMGHEGMKRIIDRGESMNPGVRRLVSLTALGAGAFLFWSARGG